MCKLILLVHTNVSEFIVILTPSSYFLFQLFVYFYRLHEPSPSFPIKKPSYTASYIKVKLTFKRTNLIFSVDKLLSSNDDEKLNK